MRELDIAALMCSKLCHDLISPVGAMANGLEVLSDDDNEDMREHAIALLEQSARTASAKLQFARLAFGAAGSASDIIDLSYAEQVARGLFDGGKITLEWSAPAVTLPKDVVRLVLNLVLLAGDALPRGGLLKIEQDFGGSVDGSGTVTLTATGDRARLPEGAAFLDQTPEDTDGLDARAIQPYVTGLLAGRLRATAETQVDAETVIFRITLPGEAKAA